jgi:acetyl esterase/lipase
MPFCWDSELVDAMANRSVDGLPTMPTGREDWLGLRQFLDAGMEASSAALDPQATVAREDVVVTSHDGVEVSARWYTAGHRDGGSGPAVVYMHGGGMICGSLDLYDRVVAAYVAESGVPMLSVDYRLAPEHPHPHPAEDCYAGLAWLSAHARQLGVDPNRIAVMGGSAGGGLAAATTLLARDRSLPVAKQILIYPMLDDRTTTPDPALVPFATWSYDQNYVGWHALLGQTIGTEEVPPTAAPARAINMTGLADAYIEVGELDIFRDECVSYARRLSMAGVSSELHVHPGCPHAFDRVAATSGIGRRARADRIRVLLTL